MLIFKSNIVFGKTNEINIFIINRLEERDKLYFKH